MSRTVIVGASVAGVRTAESLRSQGYDGSITLVGEEGQLPYDKPPLSKGLLARTVEDDAVQLLTERQAEALDITLALGGRATGLDLGGQTVEVEGRGAIAFDTLVVATGSRARPSPWGDRPGLHVLRTLRDATLLRADLELGGPVVVIGAGFIGAEVAATARSLGIEVTVVDPLPAPMNQALPVEIGELVAQLHRRHGVHTIFGHGVETIDGEHGEFSVRLTDGRDLAAATVVVGIGAVPNDDWLRGTGLLVDDGLVCDQYCRAVGAPAVSAVGDVARWSRPDRSGTARLEHWTNAVDQAVCVAHNIAEPDELHAYAPVEFVWSDQYDWRIQVLGRTGGPGESIMLRDPGAEERMAVLYPGPDGALGGAVILNWPRALVTCRKALRHGESAAHLRTQIIG